MKKKTILAAILAAVAVLLVACTPASRAQSSQPAGEVTNMVYRGQVDEMKDDGSILVSQMDGYNYGQASILFHVNEATTRDETVGVLAQDAYVEVWYDGILTRSLPGQGTAQSVTVIAPHSLGIVVNGTIKSVEASEEGYRINILPFDAAVDAVTNHVILNVPQTALEGLAEADLKEGTEVSAVTKGIAALSLPPQMPVVVLLPYLPMAQ